MSPPETAPRRSPVKQTEGSPKGNKAKAGSKTRNMVFMTTSFSNQDKTENMPPTAAGFHSPAAKQVKMQTELIAM